MYIALNHQEATPIEESRPVVHEASLLRTSENTTGFSNGRAPIIQAVISSIEIFDGIYSKSVSW